MTNDEKIQQHKEKKIRCQSKIKTELNIVNEHLSIALGEFSKYVGSLHLGSLTEYKDLVRIKLKLEHIIKKCNRKIV